jgi:hypothetical protein
VIASFGGNPLPHFFQCGLQMYRKEIKIKNQRGNFKNQNVFQVPGLILISDI